MKQITPYFPSSAIGESAQLIQPAVCSLYGQHRHRHSKGRRIFQHDLRHSKSRSAEQQQSSPVFHWAPISITRTSISFVSGATVLQICKRLHLYAHSLSVSQYNVFKHTFPFLTSIWSCLLTPDWQHTPPAPGRRWWKREGCQHHYPLPPDFLSLCWPSHLYR